MSVSHSQNSSDLSSFVSFANRQYLLFDLDGTLVDSAPDLASAINRMLKALSLDTFDEEVIRGWVGNGAQVLVHRALSGSAELDNSIESERLNNALEIFLHEYESQLCVDSCLYSNVKETLIELKQRGYQLSIVTNKPERFVAPILSALGIDTLFDVIIGGDTLEKRKPDPLPLFHACQQLSIEVDQAVMIGDSKNDILAAKAANMPSIGLTYGYNYGEPIDQYEPEFVFEDFGLLLTIFS